MGYWVSRIALPKGFAPLKMDKWGDVDVDPLWLRLLRELSRTPVEARPTADFYIEIKPQKAYALT